jgi:hypothetical protein
LTYRILIVEIALKSRLTGQDHPGGKVAMKMPFGGTASALQVMLQVMAEPS